jgi:hypothetical protein
VPEKQRDASKDTAVYLVGLSGNEEELGLSNGTNN